MKTAIVFDLDGTLLDSLGDLVTATNHALAVHGYPPRTQEEIRRFVGNGAEKLIRLSLGGDPAPALVQAVLATYKPYYDAHCRENTRPYDGIPEALAALGEAYPLAIVSNKPDSAVKALCGEYFPGIFALGETPECPRKPAPDMVCRAMKELGAESCVYVGDSEVDIRTAKNVGIPCLSVTWGFRDRETLMAAGAEHLCDTPTELLNAIEKI